MKTIYKVKVTIKLGEIESSNYSIIDIIDNGINDSQEIEILFDSMADFIKSRSETKGKNLLASDCS